MSGTLVVHTWSYVNNCFCQGASNAVTTAFKNNGANGARLMVPGLNLPSAMVLIVNAFPALNPPFNMVIRGNNMVLMVFKLGKGVRSPSKLIPCS